MSRSHPHLPRQLHLEFFFFFPFFCLFSFCSSLLQMCIIMWLPSILPFRCTLWFKIISHRTYSSLALIYLAEPFSEPRAAFCTYIADERSSFLFFFFFVLFSIPADADAAMWDHNSCVIFDFFFFPLPFVYDLSMVCKSMRFATHTHTTSNWTNI